MFLYPASDVKNQDENAEKPDVEAASDDDDHEKEREIDLLIAKNRQGALSNIEYLFYGDECRFRELKIRRAKKKDEETKEKEQAE
jgi:replicative DNA helicase